MTPEYYERFISWSMNVWRCSQSEAMNLRYFFAEGWNTRCALLIIAKRRRTDLRIGGCRPQSSNSRVSSVGWSLSASNRSVHMGYWRPRKRATFRTFRDRTCGVLSQRSLSKFVRFLIGDCIISIISVVMCRNCLVWSEGIFRW